ncbi:hypothetical protein JCM33374_g5847 [Metschnikowia sp. JCM 33374]|nr:hypothetical protein JCM33374_g5847 [Metschnikowia sp. JCM 33374]
MVKLTQVDDETATKFETTAPAAGAQTYSDSESDSESDYEDDFDIENETLYDRIVALKDVVPPTQRTQIVNAVESAKSIASSAFSKGGSLLWGVTSSILLLGVPLSLAILSETQLQEMEKELTLQKSAQEVLAPGSEGAFNGEKTAA